MSGYYRDIAAFVKMSRLEQINGYVCEHFADGGEKWYLNTKLHREDGPAVIRSNGDKIWYIKGLRHREDGPAEECTDKKAWYIYGENHRKNGPALIEKNNKEWRINGRLHRKRGPAIIKTSLYEALFIGSEQICIYGPDKIIHKHWYKEGKLHRKDGPAIETSNGYKIWYINGEIRQWYINGKIRQDVSKPTIEYPDKTQKYLINGKLILRKK